MTMKWPIMGKAVEEAVSTELVSLQLHKNISIYGSGGVFMDFDTEFKVHHGASSSYALLHNSGG